MARRATHRRRSGTELYLPEFQKGFAIGEDDYQRVRIEQGG